LGLDIGDGRLRHRNDRGLVRRRLKPPKPKPGISGLHPTANVYSMFEEGWDLSSKHCVGA
jgi:hypothetical protein